MAFSTFLKRNFNVLSKDNQQDIERIREQKRFVPFPERPTHSHIPIDTLLMSQGVKNCMTWRGIELGKSVYDFALLSMIIWENSPATILEIGSGEGASAAWMADLCKTYGLHNTRVLSIDIEPPSIEHEGVTFLQGNSEEIDREKCVKWEWFHVLKERPHPWLILEDAHVNINGILEYFSNTMHTGDYIIIEDSRGRLQTKLEVPNTLYVDTYYCDYFGRNATSSMNTILCKWAGRFEGMG